MLENEEVSGIVDEVVGNDNQYTEVIEKVTKDLNYLVDRLQ